MTVVLAHAQIPIWSETLNLFAKRFHGTEQRSPFNLCHIKNNSVKHQNDCGPKKGSEAGWKKTGKVEAVWCETWLCPWRFHSCGKWLVNQKLSLNSWPDGPWVLCIAISLEHLEKLHSNEYVTFQHNHRNKLGVNSVAVRHALDKQLSFLNVWCLSEGVVPGIIRVSEEVWARNTKLGSQSSQLFQATER